MNGAFVMRVIFWTDYISPMSNIYETYPMVVAANQIIILWVMDRAILKTLENRLKEKVGQTVQSLDIISQEFIVVLVTGLKILTNFDVVKWLQVTKSTVKCYATIITWNHDRKYANMHSLNSKLMRNYTGKEQSHSILPNFFQLTISFGDQLNKI